MDPIEPARPDSSRSDAATAAHGLRLALYQPDIPQNAGAILRLAACFGAPLDVIEPAGFVWSDAKLRRAGLDYAAKAHLVRHPNWDGFLAGRTPGAPGAEAETGTETAGRLLLFTTHGSVRYTDFAFAPGDTLLFGRESAGAPDAVHAAADARLAIPLRPGMRSLNVAQAAAMALGEALRQLDGFPAAEVPPPASQEDR